MDFQQYQQKLSQSIGKQNLLLDKIEGLKKQEKKLEDRKYGLEEAQVFLQDIAKKTQDQICFHISDIVQLAVDSLFPEKYKFSLVFEIKRGKTEAKLLFLDESGYEVDPMEDSGGGLVDISSLGLRVACWSLSKTDNVMILDEPYKHVSEDLQEQAAAILSELSKTLKLQFIVVSHRKQIIDVADRVFEVKLEKEGKYRISKVTEIQ